MSKAISYYDWNLAFSKSDDREISSTKKDLSKKFNSIGIAEEDFKDYLKKWKSEHLN